MKFLRGNILHIFIFVLAAIITVGMIITPRQKHKQTPQRRVIFGAWTEGLLNPSTRALQPEKLLLFEKLIHRKVTIAHYYIGWEALEKPELLTQFDLLRSQGWVPMLNVNPYYFQECPAADLPLYRAIAEGRCDKFLHAAGRNLSKAGQPFYLLFAWEMNNKDNQWSIPYTGSSAKEFISAWRRIHTIFEQEKADKVIWVFCPNVPDDPVAAYEDIYPGNAYVDWVGLDGYNWGTTQEWSQWSGFAGVFGDAYGKMARIAPGKPLVIAEVNTTDRGGDKAAWYKDMFNKQIPYSFPNIAAVVIFNEDRSHNERVNWRVDVAPESLEAFKSAVNNPLYQ